MEKIGFIGLGVMGVRMSKRLAEVQYPITAFDISPEARSAAAANGCIPVDTLHGAVESSDVVISMLPTPAIIREVVLGEGGILETVRPGTTVIDMSTSSPLLAREMAEAFREKGAEILDAPVSGGKAGAENGTLAIMVGGNRMSFETVRPILSHLGKNIFYVGESGAGHTIKLVNNLLFSIIMAATSEAMVFGTKAGLDPEVLRDVMLAGSATSYALREKVLNFVLPRNFEAGFSVALQTKDIDLALQLGKDIGTPLIMGNLVRQFYQSVIAAGKVDKDTSVIYEFFEQVMQ